MPEKFIMCVCVCLSVMVCVAALTSDCQSWALPVFFHFFNNTK